uniref:Glycoprotein IB-binding protein subunit beta n=1 Tax=Lygus hesperus TaxID=30085 RepID=A0A0A9WBK9_LYGHE
MCLDDDLVLEDFLRYAMVEASGQLETSSDRIYSRNSKSLYCLILTDGKRYYVGLERQQIHNLAPCIDQANGLPPSLRRKFPTNLRNVIGSYGKKLLLTNFGISLGHLDLYADGTHVLASSVPTCAQATVPYVLQHPIPAWVQQTIAAVTTIPASELSKDTYHTVPTDLHTTGITAIGDTAAAATATTNVANLDHVIQLYECIVSKNVDRRWWPTSCLHEAATTVNVLRTHIRMQYNIVNCRTKDRWICVFRASSVCDGGVNTHRSILVGVSNTILHRVLGSPDPQFWNDEQ